MSRELAKYQKLLGMRTSEKPVIWERLVSSAVGSCRVQMQIEFAWNHGHGNLSAV